MPAARGRIYVPSQGDSAQLGWQRRDHDNHRLAGLDVPTAGDALTHRHSEFSEATRAPDRRAGATLVRSLSSCPASCGRKRGGAQLDAPIGAERDPRAIVTSR
jgi:hypothetical protein